MRTIMSRKVFSATFKQEIAEATLNSGDTYSVISKKFGVTNHQVARWTNEYTKGLKPWVRKLNLQAKNNIHADEVEKDSKEEIDRIEVQMKLTISNADLFSVAISLSKGSTMTYSNLTAYQIKSIVAICNPHVQMVT